jgi:hypothetical protein
MSRLLLLIISVFHKHKKNFLYVFLLLLSTTHTSTQSLLPTQALKQQQKHESLPKKKAKSKQSQVTNMVIKSKKKIILRTEKIKQNGMFPTLSTVKLHFCMYHHGKLINYVYTNMRVLFESLHHLLQKYVYRNVIVFFF